MTTHFVRTPNAFCLPYPHRETYNYCCILDTLQLWRCHTTTTPRITKERANFSTTANGTSAAKRRSYKFFHGHCACDPTQLVWCTFYTHTINTSKTSPRLEPFALPLRIDLASACMQHGRFRHWRSVASATIKNDVTDPTTVCAAIQLDLVYRRSANVWPEGEGSMHDVLKTYATTDVQT